MPVTAADLFPEPRLRESYVRHGVRAQAYRFWAAEAAGAQPDDALADAGAWPAIERQDLPTLEACDIELAPGAARLVTADRSIALDFARGEDFLPKLRRLDRLHPPGDRSGVPASATADRARAAVHYFIALVENPARDVLPFHELLGDTFALGYTPTPIADLGALETWVKGALSSVVASEHDIHSITVEDAGNGCSTVKVRMTSQALFPDGSGAISRNTQSWSLIDTPGLRFPRIAEILIARDAVEFFGPAPDYAPRARP